MTTILSTYLKQPIYWIELQRAKKADRLLVPTINGVETIAMFISIWNSIFNPYILSWLTLIGIASFVFGTFIYLKAKKTLGKYFSEKLRLLQDHKLVTSGIYSHIRHPIYSGEILLLLGFTLMLNSLPGFAIMLLFIPLILLRIPFEEAMLRETYPQYNDYIKQTKKLIPRLYWTLFFPLSLKFSP